MKEIIKQLFTDSNGQHEMSAYSWVFCLIAVVGFAIYKEWANEAILLTDLSTALTAVAAGHGAAYWARK